MSTSKFTYAEYLKLEERMTELKRLADELAKAVGNLARKDDELYPVSPYIQDGVAALAAYRKFTSAAGSRNARLPEEHLAVVLEALMTCEKEARGRAFEISGGQNRAHYRNKADRYAATRRFLEVAP
jgi:hypothetical protein